MRRKLEVGLRRRWMMWLVIVLAGGSARLAGEPTRAAAAGYDAYVRGVEMRLARQHGGAEGFLAGMDGAESRERVRRGELIVEQIKDAGAGAMPGAMLHHWRGTAFAAGASAADFDRVMRDFAGYPRYFAPQVLSAKVTAADGDFAQVTMRVRQKHVIAVVMDSSYDVRFGRLDAQRGWSVSKSTRMAEIDAPGTGRERPLSASEEHGFLWRQDTYWSYEERDGGLYLQIESVSLSREIPRGLGWAVGPFVESVPRESLEFTLRAVCDAVRKERGEKK